MEYRGYYISLTPDCGPNEGGYYCQVYQDQDYSEQMLPLGTTLRTKFVGTRTGKTKWLEAEIVEVPDAY